MWASIMYNNAKYEKPVYPIVIILSLIIILGHLLTSQVLIEPIVLEVHEVNHEMVDQPANISEGGTITLELPRVIANALRKNQREVLRDLEFLRYSIQFLISFVIDLIF